MDNQQSTEETLAERLLRPFYEFTEAEISGGILLLLCTLLALAWANSPFAASYIHLWNIHIMLGIGKYVLDKPLQVWINDGLMAIFFLLVGMEIKREVLVGELSSFQQARLPIIASLGGMLIPAMIYAALNAGTVALEGWAIPMATDIAFALGIFTLVGKGLPSTLKVFLTAFAIVSDLGTMFVVAIFYHSTIHAWSLVAAGFVLLCLIAANFIGIRSLLVYSALGFCLWLAIFLSGLHATIAGMLLALVIPARARIDSHKLATQGRALLDIFEQDGLVQAGLYMTDNQQTAVQTLQTACEQAEAPLQRMEHILNPWVAFGIIPLFALANAGISLYNNLLANLINPVSLGIIIGLVVGKQAGMMLFSWLTVKLRWSNLPDDVSWPHLYGTSWLSGIGFTMPLLISALTFGENDPQYLSAAKTGIIVAVLISSSIGWLILRRQKEKTHVQLAAES